MEVKIGERLADIKSRLTGKEKLLYWLGLLPIFALALWIRTRNLPLLKGKYLIELDSYYFFRYAKMLLEQGSLPPIDYMRYVPVGYPTKGLFFPKTLVFLYKLIHPLFPNLSQIEWHIIYPPVITIIAFIFFFLLVKELTNYRTAFISTAFLAVIPAYIQRTGAGFADHEAIAALWFFTSLWLFVLAWKNNKTLYRVPLAASSGIFGALMAGSWGGYIFLPASLALFTLCYVLLTNDNQKSILTILPWVCTYFGLGYFTTEIGFDFIKAWVNLLLVFALSFVAINLLVNKTLVKKIKLEKYTTLVSLCLTTAVALLINFFGKFVSLSDFITLLTKKGVSRHFFTVAENAAPYFTDWWNGFSVLILLAFGGFALCFYYLFYSKNEKRLGFVAAGASLLFLVTFLIGRFSSSGSQIVEFFSKTYLAWLGIFILSLGIIWLFAAMKNKDLEFEKKWAWLLIALLFILPLLAARGQIRLLFITVPPIALTAGIFTSEVFDLAKNLKMGLKVATIVIISLVALFGFAMAASSSATINKYSGSMVPGQWEDAMRFLREQTPKGSVVAHWWDYGHLTIALGERAAVTDGGNAMGWNHKSGRYFLTGKDVNSTLAYLKSHNVTHILISEEEIPKYHAFSYIGSDENLDRESTIGVFELTQQKEVRNGTMLIYEGGWPLDKDYPIGKIVLPKDYAGIGGFSFVLSNNTLSEPFAYVVYNKGVEKIPISCVYINGKRMDFQSENQSLPGCLVFIPAFQGVSGTTYTIRTNPIGGALWLSEKVWDTNFAKLYIYNESSPYFKLVYEDQTPLAIYQGRLIGPIKIWEVQYPDWVQPDPYYLEPDPMYG